ncbi:MAG: Asp-tRNA(Asn)/Glu-tRNA(Gln) amidotransferase subunit GatA [Atopostipes suicloacalis]|nr:Asp-tRNA(Asn)/Glu-tRNA(Gln) amidotransferase subunit GatA [Atopostipes suicloacalis]
MMTLHTKSIEELHELLVKEELTVTQLVQANLDYIESVEEEIAAFIHLDKEGALKRAKEIDARGVDKENPLDGIPIAIKDNIVTKNGKTTAASKMLENFESVYDATVIEKLEAAGMILIGKTNLDEFAMGATTESSKIQITKNPWDKQRVPGGSSGGSAAAVSAAMVTAALGSDTGGSIRQPASYTNLVGLKPTYGAVSRYGLIAFASSLDQIGPMTRSVKDNALILNAISGLDEKDGTSANIDIDFTEKIGQDIKGLKIGLPKEMFDGKIVDLAILEKVREAVKALENKGAEVVELSLPHLKYGVATYYAIATAEASSNLQAFDGIRYGYHAEDVEDLEELYVKSRSEGFGLEVKKRIILGALSLNAKHYDELYGQAAKIRTIIRQEFEEALAEVDVLIGPSTTTIAPSFDKVEDEDPIAAYQADLLTVPVNLAGIPALSVPVGFSNEMPVGMQIIGNYFDEATLYQLAAAFEKDHGQNHLFPALEGGVNE